MYNGEEELLNKSYDKYTVSKYILEAKLLILSGIKLEEIHKNDNFKAFRSRMNKICIHDAQIVDLLLNNSYGRCWLSAYSDLPDQNKTNVGLLTFNLIYNH
jgi:hypothetical protein